MSENSWKKVIRAYKNKLLFTSLALNQMNLSDRMILKEEVVETILNGNVIEEYPDDSRGESYLICSAKPGRIIHVVCAPKNEYLVIITAYVPTIDKWEENLRSRRK